MPQRMLSLASFFSIEAREYAHITFDAAARTTVRNVILGFCAGILIAALYAFYQKTIPGGIVRTLLRCEAFSEDTAKTAAELGWERNILFRFELAHNGMLKKLIRTVSAPADAAEGEETEAELRYYIPQELKYRAEVRFDKQGSGPVGLIVTLALTLLLSIALIRLLPALLGVVDRLLG